MGEAQAYQYLENRPDNSIRQPFVPGRNIWAEVLYRETVGEDPRSPEEVAEDFEVPLGAVLEAIDYCIRNEAYLREEREKLMERSRIFERNIRPSVLRGIGRNREPLPCTRCPVDPLPPAGSATRSTAGRRRTGGPCTPRRGDASAAGCGRLSRRLVVQARPRKSEQFALPTDAQPGMPDLDQRTQSLSRVGRLFF